MAPAGDVVDGEVTVGGSERGFTIRLPREPAEGPVPLVLALHGNSPTAGGWSMREMTTFDQQADTWGWAVAYPNGQGGCWADGRGVTTADEAGVDDVTFLRALVDWAADRHGTTPDRVVVAGISNGAFMAHRLATELSDRVAVLAAVAGGLPEALRDRTPTHAVSALLIHGTEDSVSPIGGGYSRHLGPDGEPRGRTISLDETADHWRAVDRCPGPGETHATELSSRTTADGGVGGTSVVAWTVFGGGHTWPGNPPNPAWNEAVTQEFDAAEEICRFAAPLLLAPDNRKR
jgi:polyhydroxybutyrate depolymerase